MELKEEDIDLIEKYLSDSASDEEIARFKLKLNNDPEFAARAELFKCIKENINSDSGAFETLLDKIHETYEMPSATPNTSASWGLKNYYYLAASIVLFLVAFFVIRTYNATPSTATLYALNFTVPPENITTRDSENMDNNLIAAIDAYRKQNFEIAIDNFTSFLKAFPDNDAANFYLGVSYLANNQGELSEKHFQSVIDSQDSIYRNAAQWYLGLAYLKSNDIKNAKTIFERLTAGTSSYAAGSGKILEDLAND